MPARVKAGTTIASTMADTMSYTMTHNHMNQERESLIRLSDVSMTWEHRNVLENVNLTINRGDFIAITGPNGGGKTTLLRIILRLLIPTKGSVEYIANGKQRLRIGYLPQKNHIDSHFPITVREIIASGLIGTGMKATKERVDALLTLTELHSKAAKTLGELSGGQMQRALFGRALISQPEVLVLDEPLSYVDKHFEHHMYDLLRQLAPTTTIILVSHEMSTIASLANRHIIVDHTLHLCHSATHFVHYDCDEC